MISNYDYRWCNLGQSFKVCFGTCPQLSAHGINGKALAEVFCDWSEEQAYQAVREFLAGQEAAGIEGVISNNDAMALGALKALRERGYNLEPYRAEGLYVPILGIDGDDEVLELVRDGFMVGTALQDPQQYAQVTLDLIESLTSGSEFDAQKEGVELGDNGQIIIPFIKIGPKEAALLKPR
ncbi:MAG: substrate-binding domain-containing protein [Succinivibrio sp.]|nr:substrate-binding domain-containing protein [Succinivibrio sp.]